MWVGWVFPGGRSARCGTGLNENALTFPGGDGLEHLETILVVEDEPGVRRVIKLILEVQGYRVLAAEKVEQALRLADGEGDSIDRVRALLDALPKLTRDEPV